MISPSIAPHDEHWVNVLTRELANVRIAHRAAILQGRPWLVVDLGKREALLVDDIVRLTGERSTIAFCESRLKQGETK